MIEETVSANIKANLHLCLVVNIYLKNSEHLQYVIHCTNIPVPVLTELHFSLDKNYKTNKPSDTIESTQVKLPLEKLA